jgi:hypothetical protein
MAEERNYFFPMIAMVAVVAVVAMVVMIAGHQSKSFSKGLTAEQVNLIEQDLGMQNLGGSATTASNYCRIYADRANYYYYMSWHVSQIMVPGSGLNDDWADYYEGLAYAYETAFNAHCLS